LSEPRSRSNGRIRGLVRGWLGLGLDPMRQENGQGRDGATGHCDCDLYRNGIALTDGHQSE